MNNDSCPGQFCITDRSFGRYLA